MATTTTPTNNPRETSIVEFEFNNKVYTDVKIIDSNDIKMIWDKAEKNALNGFEIAVQKSNSKKLARVQEQTAPRLTNILSSITGTQLSSKAPPAITIIRNVNPTQMTNTTLKARYLKPISLESIEI